MVFAITLWTECEMLEKTPFKQNALDSVIVILCLHLLFLFFYLSDWDDKERNMFKEYQRIFDGGH